MKNKKGSHVGMILSFLVFITFIAFLYSVIEPATRSNEDKKNLMEYLKVELLNEFSADMSTLTLKINRIPVSAACVSIDIPDPDLSEDGAIVKDVNNIIFASFAEPRKTNMGLRREGVIKIYYSEELDKGRDLGVCDLLREGDNYDISLFKTDKEIFGSKITHFSDSISSNKTFYEELKQKYGMGVGEEFGFVFNDENKNFIVGTEDVNVSTDVFVEEIPIQYIDSEANIKSGFLDIKVW